MSSYNQPIIDVTIPNGSANSNVVKARKEYNDALAIMLLAPEVITDGQDTFVIQVTDDPEVTSPVWRDLQEDIAGVPTDVSPPGAGKARTYFILPPSMGFRIHNDTGNVSADTTWAATKMFRLR